MRNKMRHEVRIKEISLEKIIVLSIVDKKDKTIVNALQYPGCPVLHEGEVLSRGVFFEALYRMTREPIYSNEAVHAYAV
jgi:hypothetical protein